MNRKIDEKVEQELLDIRLELLLKIRVLKFQVDLIEAVLFSEEFETYTMELDACEVCQTTERELTEVTHYNSVGDREYSVRCCGVCLPTVVKAEL